MALSAAIVWEVRSAGSDTLCSGGFKAGATGTDYSQQNAAQYNATDLVVDAVTNTKVTSASHSFVAADVGNILRITAGAGWTTGFYEIVSVASGAATLDRSPAATGTTGGTYYVGGAFASPGQAGGAKVAGNTVYIQGATYLMSGSANTSGGPISDTTGGTGLTAPSFWIGYQSSRGDLGTRPVLKANANGLTLLSITAAHVTVDNLEVDGNSGSVTGAIGINISSASNIRVSLRRCKATNCPTGFYVAVGSVILDRCEASGCGSGGAFVIGAAGITCVNCTSKNGTGIGFDVSNFATLTACLVFGHTGQVGFNTSQASVMMRNCTASGCGTGFKATSTVGNAHFVNCLAANSSALGFDGGGVANLQNRLVNCAGYSNGSGHYSTAEFTNTMVESFQTLAADPFVNAASNDFSLNNTGGSPCRAAGSPASLPGTSTLNYLDIGAVQHQDSGGGSVTVYLVQTQTAVIRANIGVTSY